MKELELIMVTKVYKAPSLAYMISDCTTPECLAGQSTGAVLELHHGHAVSYKQKPVIETQTDKMHQVIL